MAASSEAGEENKAEARHGVSNAKQRGGDIFVNEKYSVQRISDIVTTWDNSQGVSSHKAIRAFFG